MWSSDDEARSPGLGASSSEHAVPALDSEDSYDEDELPQNIQGMGYKSDDWCTVLWFLKGHDAIMGEDKMQLRIYAACNQLMRDARMVFNGPIGRTCSRTDRCGPVETENRILD